MTTEEKEISPGSYVDFLHYLDTVTTEEALFSRLTYWFAFQTSPDDVHSRIDLVEQRARELRLWDGLDLKVERWMQACKEEFNTMDREAFTAFVTQDYTAYRDGTAGQKGKPPAPECMKDVKSENVQWLVPELLPLGELSLLGADGGTGKGIWQAQLIAYVTAGKTSGFFPVPPPQTGKVLILAGEDDPGKVLRGRLLAAGADMEKVMVVTSDDYYIQTGKQLCIKDKALADFVDTSEPILMILDPLQSFLPADVEMASRNQMRNTTLPLKGISRTHNLATLIAMHTNKKQGVAGRARLADSSDIWDIARSVIMMGRSRNDGKIYVSHEKSSYSRQQQTVLMHIEDVTIDGIKTARAVFDGYTDKKDIDFVEERRFRQAQTKDDARDAILNVLAESNTASMASPQLKSAVMQEIGCSEPTYKRAYSELVKSGEIAKYQLNQKDGVRGWFTRLAYRSESEDTETDI